MPQSTWMGLPPRSRCSTRVQGPSSTRGSPQPECGRHVVNHLTREDAILSHLVVSVRGDLGFAALDEDGDPTKGMAHIVVPFTWPLVRESSVIRVGRHHGSYVPKLQRWPPKS